MLARSAATSCGPASRDRRSTFRPDTVLADPRDVKPQGYEHDLIVDTTGVGTGIVGCEPDTVTWMMVRVVVPSTPAVAIMTMLLLPSTYPFTVAGTELRSGYALATAAGTE